MNPMLAATTDGSNLTYPLLASPKLDGVRALVIDGVVVSRSLKPIPNKYVQKLFGKKKFNNLDGELIVGDATAADVFQQTQSGVMSINGEPDVRFWVFDKYCVGEPFVARLSAAQKIADPHIVPVPYQHINNLTKLLEVEVSYLVAGFEGVMLRSYTGKYKHGRSTLKQQGLLKLKRFEDSEAEVIGVTQRLHNTNEAQINELGYKERSSKQVGLIPVDELGAFQVRDLKTRIEFELGTGFTQAQRKEFWDSQDELLNRVVKYKYQPVGVKEKPRFPVFLGFRDRRDL